MVLQRFCSLSGLVGSVNNTSTVCKGRAALFSPALPKRKSKYICLKIISGKSYAAFYLPFLLVLPWSAPGVSVHSMLFQQWQVVRSGSVAVLSLEPCGHWSSQFIPFRWSHNTISNPEAVPHTAVWGWMLKVPCGCRSCWASEKSVSKCKRIHQSLLRTPLTCVFKGIWVAVLKPRRLRGQQPSFLAPTNSYHVSDSRDTGAGKRERTPPGSSLC